MTTTTTNFDADASNTLIATLNKSINSGGPDQVRIDAYGDFGSGTLTFAYSPDEGTTKISLKDGIGGSAISFTDDEGFVWEAPLNSDKAILLYATLASSTSPDLNVKVSNPQEV